LSAPSSEVDMKGTAKAKTRAAAKKRGGARRTSREDAAASPERGRTRGRRDRIEVGGVSLSNPDKVLYAGQDVTKLDLARYYEGIAEWILPHIADRPLTLVRCPSGRGDCFYQKHIGRTAHPAILRVEIPGDPEPYGAVRNLEGLVALVQLGVLELHTWGAHRDRVERP